MLKKIKIFLSPPSPQCVNILWKRCGTFFWKTGNKQILTIATIINEQNYLEKRVIQNKYFKKNVLNSIGFKLFDFFQFNHILFPFSEENTVQKTILIGDTMKHFTSLHERILLGKRLYTLLFHDEHVFSSYTTMG